MLTGITNRDAVVGPSTQALGKYHGLEDIHSKHNRKPGVAYISHLTPNFPIGYENSSCKLDSYRIFHMLPQ